MDLGRSVVIVEDEATIREAVCVALRKEGYAPDAFDDGLTAWQAFERGLPDIAILDIGLPRMDGLELCRKLRTLSDTIPIIFVTSREEEFDRVLGLELGADDYLCKPFSMRELAARVKVLLRRAALSREPDGGEERVLEAGPLRLDLRRYQAAWKGAPLALTVTELNLLQALVRHPGHVKTRAQLLEEAYPHDDYASDRTIDSHIKRLRRKLVEADPSFDGIETVYGLGYRFRQGG